MVYLRVAFPIYPCYIRDRKAALAQLVEQHFCKMKVLGSNPRGGSACLINPLVIFVVNTTDTFHYMKKLCDSCMSILKTRHQVKYCSSKCQSDHKYKLFVDKWKNGLVDGTIGIYAKNISGHIRRYLAQKYGDRCSECGWSKKNILTQRVPLEIDHIDGNAENNLENNLVLLCPNCHALTSFYKNMNRGKGRKWRMDKYIKNL